MSPASQPFVPAFAQPFERPEVFMRRLLLLLGILAPSVACDQATKSLAVTHLAGKGSLDVVSGIFRLVYAENPGAFLGLGRALPDPVRTALLSVGVAAMLAALAFVIMRKRTETLAAVGLAFMLAGGIGNLIDRTTRPGGRVVDFAQLGISTSWGHVRTGVFNVADIHIMLGAGLVTLSVFRKKPEKSEAAPGSAPIANAP